VCIDIIGNKVAVRFLADRLSIYFPINDDLKKKKKRKKKEERREKKRERERESKRAGEGSR
jgi:hypothetical protein